MNRIFDEAKWVEYIKKPDWYLVLWPKIKEVELKIKNQELPPSTNGEILNFFEKHLAAADITLGRDKGNWDKGRKKIDTVIIHHTAGSPGLTKERLSALELLRLYMPYYAQPHHKVDSHIVGQPITSGHVRNGKQVFYPYHWIVRTNGMVERLLLDKEIGWHAGNSEINSRSVAIVFDNNYQNSRPSEVELESAANLIKQHYASVSKKRIFGHREVRLLGPTSCPSDLFLTTAVRRGWKEDLISLV